MAQSHVLVEIALTSKRPDPLGVKGAEHPFGSTAGPACRWRSSPTTRASPGLT